jgi:hypothetical protein
VTTIIVKRSLHLSLKSHIVVDRCDAAADTASAAAAADDDLVSIYLELVLQSAYIFYGRS